MLVRTCIIASEVYMKYSFNSDEKMLIVRCLSQIHFELSACLDKYYSDSDRFKFTCLISTLEDLEKILVKFGVLKLNDKELSE